MQCTVLTTKGSLRTTTLPVTAQGIPSVKDICVVLRRANLPEYIGTWTWGSLLLHLYGYKTGKKGFENKHELPPPYESLELFGEAVVVATTNASDPVLSSLNTQQYQSFLKDAFKEEEDAQSDYESEVDEEDDGDGDAQTESSVSDIESESDTESDLPIEEEEEPEEKPVYRAPRIKRNNKKTPYWYSIEELTDSNSHMSLQRIQCARQIHHFTKQWFTTEQQEILEKAIFQTSIKEANQRKVRTVWENPDFCVLYDTQVRRVLRNLHEHPRILSRMEDGEFTVDEIPFMAYANLCPEKWKDLFEHQMKRETKMLEVDMSMATDQFRCSKCGKRQCTFYEQQTRSADEPMTIFVRCLNCGKHWRQ
jgi:DNA-directed RNA polymerase subunit M/transcription elongation factor TFIIS